MPKIPVVTARKLMKVLKKDGFKLDHIQGSHHILYHPTKKRTVSVPVHSGHDLGRGITRAILQDADISLDTFLKLV